MPLQIDTKDCTALSDAELSEMADICADGAAGYDVGILSKHAEQWVLITRVHDGRRLSAFSFCTLERIGGTPAVLVGLASVKRSPRRDAVVRSLMGDQLRRAVLAFPDEDVLVGTRLLGPGAFAAFDGLADIVPRPGHRASGEERAWARRLAKRFGAEGRVDDRSFVVRGTGDVAPGLDHECVDSDGLDPAVVAFFDGVDHGNGDSLIAFGWAMAEDLAARSRR
jgi:hypothetical protein